MHEWMQKTSLLLCCLSYALQIVNQAVWVLFINKWLRWLSYSLQTALCRTLNLFNSFVFKSRVKYFWFPDIWSNRSHDSLPALFMHDCIWGILHCLEILHCLWSSTTILWKKISRNALLLFKLHGSLEISGIL